MFVDILPIPESNDNWQRFYVDPVSNRFLTLGKRGLKEISDFILLGTDKLQYETEDKD